MLVSEKIKEMTFHGNTTKDAYLKACKWYASNVIATGKESNVTCQFEKVKSKTSLVCSVRLTLFVTAKEDDVKQRHCDICNEVNKMFYIQGNKNKCDSCKVNPYRERLKEKLKRLKEGMKV